MLRIGDTVTINSPCHSAHNRKARVIHIDTHIKCGIQVVLWSGSEPSMWFSEHQLIQTTLRWNPKTKRIETMHEVTPHKVFNHVVWNDGQLYLLPDTFRCDTSGWAGATCKVCYKEIPHGSLCISSPSIRVGWDKQRRHIKCVVDMQDTYGVAKLVAGPNGYIIDSGPTVVKLPDEPKDPKKEKGLIRTNQFYRVSRDIPRDKIQIEQGYYSQVAVSDKLYHKIRGTWMRCVNSSLSRRSGWFEIDSTQFLISEEWLEHDGGWRKAVITAAQEHDREHSAPSELKKEATKTLEEQLEEVNLRYDKQISLIKRQSWSARQKRRKENKTKKIDSDAGWGEILALIFIVGLTISGQVAMALGYLPTL